MAAKYFDIVERTKYLIELKEVKGLEDCGDDFVTTEEAEEMGIPYVYSGRQVLKHAVVTKINEYLSAIKEGNKSIVIDDQELLDMFVSTDRSVSEFVANTRRVGNRLFKHTKAEKVRDVVTYKDYCKLINNITGYLRNTHNVHVDFKTSYSNRQSMAKFACKMVDWDELEQFCKTETRIQYVSETDLKLMKMLYDDPTLIEEVKQNS